MSNSLPSSVSFRTNIRHRCGVAMAALHQVKWPGAPCLLLCFGNSVNRKYTFHHIWPFCFILTVKVALAACVLRATTKKRSSTFLRKKVHPEKIPVTPMSHWRSSSVAPQCKILATPLTPGDLACGFSDFEMTWLLYITALAPPLWRCCDS